MSQDATNLFYLLSSVLFIIGLKQMTHPRTAARGNMISAVAMLVAVVITLIKVKIAWPVIIAGLLVGTVIGAVFALKVEMTSMPELVALFNGLGGAATIFVAAVSSIYPDSIAGLDGATITEASLMVRIKVLTPVALSGLIGAVTLSGSLIAVGKLLGKWKIFWKPVELPGGQLLNAVLLLASLGLTVGMIEAPQYVGACYLGLTLLALVLGADLGDHGAEHGYRPASWHKLEVVAAPPDRQMCTVRRASSKPPRSKPNARHYSSSLIGLVSRRYLPQPNLRI